jgi:hypothetical protein
MPITVDPTKLSSGNVTPDINTISSPPKLTVEDVNNATANGTADLNVIATSPGAPTPSTPAAISAIIADEPIAIDTAKLNADIAATMADIPIPDFSAVPVASQQDATQFEARSDWRVRLSLSPDCNYLYRSSNPGILAPLAPKSNGGTDGVIFPYTPSISVNYAATYDQTNVTHSNYKVNQYSSSSVDSVSITGDFTAQDSREANYLLAVIHFFRTMTKMFYGQDQDPKRGTPPPLCYLFGMGTFQFSAHPLAITGFSYNLPNDVDYIKTVSSYSPGAQQPSTGTNTTPGRLTGLNIGPGGKAKSPQFSKLSTNQNGEVTWVPTKIQLTITCIPMQSRNQVSNLFSLEKYATGDLLDGIKNPGGGFW